MGKAKLQAQLGVTKEKAADLFNQYHAKVPFVKQLMEKANPTEHKDRRTY